jgi:hypothetical protein
MSPQTRYKMIATLLVFAGLFTEISNSSDSSKQQRLETVKNISLTLGIGDSFDFPIIEIVGLQKKVALWRHVFIYVGSLVILFGVVSNIISIVIIHNSKLFQDSAFPYYAYTIAIIGIMNLMVRYVVPLFTQELVRSKLLSQFNATTYDEYEMYTSSVIDNSYCNVLMYSHNTLSLLWAWALVAVSVDRWLAIKCPCEDKRKKSLRTATILVFIVISSSVVNVFDFSDGYYSLGWYSNLILLCEPVDSNSDVGLKVNFGSMTINTEVYALLRIVLQAVGPFYASLIFNALVITGFKSKKKTGNDEKVLETMVSIPTSSSVKYSSEMYFPIAQEDQNVETTRALYEKYRVERDTDNMFIVFSFAVLMIQLPCTMAWYLIYHRLFIKNMTEIFSTTQTPVIMCVLQLTEMSYYSASLIFYIQLNRSLKRELMSKLRVQLLKFLKLEN